MLSAKLSRERATPTTGSAGTHVQVWFGPPDRPLFGWLSVPAGARAHGAVVLCPPMGEEGRSAHRTFRRLAEELAAAGLLALRFDYDGTGDSAGRQDDPGRVGGWLDSLGAARDHLRGLGAPAVSAVGMRLGATLAARIAADRREPFDSLVLWDPCQSGRTFLREGEALNRFAAGGTPDVPDDGLRHTPGFQYDASTAADLRGLDLGRLPAEHRLARRVLLLARDDRPLPAAIAARVDAEQAAGADVTRLPATGQSELVDVAPLDARVPEDVLARTVRWLADGSGSTAAVPVAIPEDAREATMPAAGPGSPQVREHRVRLGAAGLFGLVTDTAEPSAGSRPWVVFINVATEHHIGPGRRWVEFARELAGSGHRCVRIDLTGVGDSPSGAGGAEDVVFDPRWLTDLPDALRDLSGDGSPLVLLGLCSGGYSALEAALHLDVAAVYAINPAVTLWPAVRGTPGFSRRRRAASTPWGWLADLADRSTLPAGGVWRAYRQLALRHAPALVLWRIARRGTDLRVIASPEDMRQVTDVVAAMPLLWWLRRRGRLTLRSDPAVDHSLLSRPSQETVRADLAAYLVRHRTVRPGR